MGFANQVATCHFPIVSFALARLGQTINKDRETSEKSRMTGNQVPMTECVWFPVSDTLLRALQGLASRKNICLPVMGLKTTFCPPMMTTGSEELVLQTAGETRFVVDCKVNPVALVGHVKITFAPEGMMDSCGALANTKD